MKTEKQPFWNTGEHPILGYYYNNSKQMRAEFYQRSESKKRKEAEWR
jgi:hypothetical protein